MSKWWRAVGNLCVLTGPRIEPQTIRSRDERVSARRTGRYKTNIRLLNIIRLAKFKVLSLVAFKIKPLNVTTHQPVLPGPVGGGHPNFAIGAGERSFHSLRPSTATGEQRDNQCYLSIFQAGSLFCRLLISESGRKSATSQIQELRRQTKTAKKHLFQRLDSVLSWFCSFWGTIRQRAVTNTGPEKTHYSVDLHSIRFCRFKFFTFLLFHERVCAFSFPIL